MSFWGNVLKKNLKQSLRKVCFALSFVKRKQFADHIAVPENTMSNYETGLRKQPLLILIIYKNICGVSVDS